MAVVNTSFRSGGNVFLGTGAEASGGVIVAPFALPSCSFASFSSGEHMEAPVQPLQDPAFHISIQRGNDSDRKKLKAENEMSRQFRKKQKQEEAQ